MSLDNINPIVQLNESVQKLFGSNPIYKDLKVEQIPCVTITIELPTGATFSGTGRNKKLAKANAARKALNEIAGNKF